MNCVSLWIRIVSIILIMCLSICLCLITLKKTTYSKWFISGVLVLIFSFALFNVFASMVNPSIQTFVGAYVGFEKEATSINFLAVEYCFEVNNEKVYVSSDVISARMLALNELEIGKVYEVSFETTENLIIGVQVLEDKVIS